MWQCTSAGGLATSFQTDRLAEGSEGREWRAGRRLWVGRRRPEFFAQGAEEDGAELRGARVCAHGRKPVERLMCGLWSGFRVLDVVGDEAVTVRASKVPLDQHFKMFLIRIGSP